MLQTSPTFVAPVLGVASGTSLSLLSTTEQLRLSYDLSNDLRVTVSSGGVPTFNPSGGACVFTGNLGVGIMPDSKFQVAGSAANIRIDYNLAGDNYFDGATHNFRSFAGVQMASITAAGITAAKFIMASQQTYTPTNVTTDRAFDANSTSIDEIADCLGTLIADLQTAGLIA